MLTTLDFEGCLQRLAPVRASWTDVVVPEEVEVRPDASYRPEYAWMHAYEKQLRKRIESELGRPLTRQETSLFGPDGAFSEALSNAFLHGHGRDPRRPIRVSCAVALGGLAFVIRDLGSGFDVAAVSAKAERGGAYFRVAGNGMRALARDGVVAGYSDGGRTLALLLVFTST